MPHKRKTNQGYTMQGNVSPVRPVSSRPNMSSSNMRPAVSGYGQSKANPYARNAQAYHEVAKKQMGKGKKAAIITICAVLAILIGAGTAFGLYMNYIGNQLNRGNKTDQELMDISDALGYSSGLDKPFYMLLLGADNRAEDKDPGRSDTNIVVRVDPIEDVVTMISIPRDTKIEIDGYGTQKFNAAYAFNGAAGAIKAAEKLLDIKISHYAEVTFADLAGLVDAVGGITVENESRIDNHKCDDGDGNHYVIEKGTQHLNGGEALTFARNRDYPDGDFTRSKHQRAVVEAVVEQVTTMPITSIPGVIDAAVKCVTTDLSVTDIIGLAQQFADHDDITMYSALLPSFTQNIKGISFVINDAEKTKEMMAIVEAGEDPSEIVSNLSAGDIDVGTVDTSNTLLFDDDDAVVNGTANNNYSGGTSGGGSGSVNPIEPENPDIGEGNTSEGNTSGGGSSGGDSGGNTSTGGGSESGGGDSGGGDPSQENL